MTQEAREEDTFASSVERLAEIDEKERSAEKEIELAGSINVESVEDVTVDDIPMWILNQIIRDTNIENPQVVICERGREFKEKMVESEKYTFYKVKSHNGDSAYFVPELYDGLSESRFDSYTELLEESIPVISNGSDNLLYIGQLEWPNMGWPHNVTDEEKRVHLTTSPDWYSFNTNEGEIGFEGKYRDIISKSDIRKYAAILGAWTVLNAIVQYLLLFQLFLDSGVVDIITILHLISIPITLIVIAGKVGQRQVDDFLYSQTD